MEGCVLAVEFTFIHCGDLFEALTDVPFHGI